MMKKQILAYSKTRPDYDQRSQERGTERSLHSTEESAGDETATGTVQQPSAISSAPTADTVTSKYFITKPIPTTISSVLAAAASSSPTMSSPLNTSQTSNSQLSMDQVVDLIKSLDSNLISILAKINLKNEPDVPTSHPGSDLNLEQTTEAPGPKARSIQIIEDVIIRHGVPAPNLSFEDQQQNNEPPTNEQISESTDNTNDGKPTSVEEERQDNTADQPNLKQSATEDRSGDQNDSISHNKNEVSQKYTKKLRRNSQGPNDKGNKPLGIASTKGKRIMTRRNTVHVVVADGRETLTTRMLTEARNDEASCSTGPVPRKENAPARENLSTERLKQAEKKTKILEFVKKFKVPLKEIHETFIVQNAMLTQSLATNKKVIEIFEKFYLKIDAMFGSETEKTTENPVRKEVEKCADKKHKDKVVRTQKTEAKKKDHETLKSSKEHGAVKRSSSNHDLGDTPKKKRYEEQISTTEKRSSNNTKKEEHALKNQNNAKEKCQSRKDSDKDTRPTETHQSTKKLGKKDEYEIINKQALKINIKRKSTAAIHEKSNNMEDDHQKRLDELKIMNNLKNGGLPPEYNEHDTRWTLKYEKYAPGLVELTKGTKIYVEDIYLKKCLREATSCRRLAGLLVRELFSLRALIVCAVPGIKNVERKPQLDKWALTVLLDYVKDVGMMKSWEPYVDSEVVSSLRHVMYHIKKKVKE